MNPYIYVLSINGLLFFFSLVFYFFPPKKINNFYGYRTKKSMLNDDIWSFANQQFNKSFIRYSFLGFLAALFLHFKGREVPEADQLSEMELVPERKVKEEVKATKSKRKKKKN